MGVGCTREEERLAAAAGKLSGGAEPVFQANEDVQSAGVLLALPSLLANGLLNLGEAGFGWTKHGYYRMQSIFLLLAFMALLRIKSIEGLRFYDPGEMGKLLGLDRAPEVRTLRQKIELLTRTGDPKAWNAGLAKNWMGSEPHLAGALYVDGHVRLYYGKQTKLPKRFVSRQRLCLQGMTDYWVNDALGQPFFVVYKEVNAGLLQALRSEIIPQALKIVPQPDEEALAADPDLHRFELIFDREGYSPEFFQQMWENRIACTTYRKYQYELWPQEEFEDHEVQFPDGEIVSMRLAEKKEVRLGIKKVKVREIRRLLPSGHQTAIVTTKGKGSLTHIAGHMFARWAQENFFKYMMEHFGIDRLAGYKTEPVDETIRVKNPVYRSLENRIRSKAAQLTRFKSKFAALILEGDINTHTIQRFMLQNACLKDQIDQVEQELALLKQTKKKTPKQLAFKDLPQSAQFKTLASSKKYFIDTIKMVAYRAETAMANLLKPHLDKPDMARRLVRQILSTDADLLPDPQQGILTVRLHNLANPLHHRYALKLCEFLNQTETLFPGTDLRLRYDLVSNQIP